MLQRVLIVLACVAATGCASVVNTTTQSIKVETRTAGGETVTGAACKLANDRESISFRSGSSVEVARSGSDLQIHCAHPDKPDASARAVSRANGGMYGNIILGGAIGALIDHNKGTAYTYPTWVQLVFGKTMVFDRNGEKDGEPVAGVVTGDTVASTPAPAPGNAQVDTPRPVGPVTLNDLSGLMPATR